MMQRRNFIRSLIGALVAPKVIEALPIPAPPPVVEAVAAPVLRTYPVDIRAILTQNMLRDIQEEEDRLFIETCKRLDPQLQCTVEIS